MLNKVRLVSGSDEFMSMVEIPSECFPDALPTVVIWENMAFVLIAIGAYLTDSPTAVYRHSSVVVSDTTVERAQELSSPECV